MKSSSIILLAGTAAAVVVTARLCGQQPVAVKPVLKSATVFLQGAELNFEATASLSSGMNDVVITDLPRNTNPSSLQVSAMAEVTILSASFRLNYLTEPEEHPAVRKLRDSIELMTNHIRLLQGQRSTVKGLQELLQANREVGGENTGVQLEQLSRVYDFYQQRMTELTKQQLELEDKEKKAADRLKRLQQQLGDISQKLQQPVGQVVVAVASPAARTVRFSLSLVTPDAGWAPVYDLRVKDISAPVQISYKASVQQQTGTDWKEVRLKLSTGNPSAGAAGPRLLPWYLDFEQPRLVQQELMAPSATRQKEGRYDHRDEMSTAAAFTTVRQTQLAVEFDIALPYTIISGSKPQLVSVQEYQLPATYRYYCIPKLDDDAFLKAAVSGWEALNLLPGPAHVFFEGAYVGQTLVDVSETGDTLSILLGRDRSLVVKRETLRAFAKTQFLGDNVRKSYTYAISVRNNRKEAITLELMDQYPISQNSRIEVTLEENGGAHVNPTTGQLTWLLQLEPNQEKQVRFAFSVKYPKGRPPAGL